MSSKPEKLLDQARVLFDSDVSTTMIYTHGLNSPGIAVKSSADFLGRLRG
jgi:hypothetical protein